MYSEAEYPIGFDLNTEVPTVREVIDKQIAQAVKQLTALRERKARLEKSSILDIRYVVTTSSG